MVERTRPDGSDRVLSGMTTIGIDIGGTAVKAAVRDADGSVRLGISPGYHRPDRATLRAAVLGAVDGVGGRDARAVGLCVPGRRSADGSCVELSVNVPGLVGYRFDELVSDALGCACPLVVLGDAEAATLDAATRHPGKRRVLGIALGAGVGAALVEDGVPLRIGTGSIGHFGQIDVGPVSVSGASAAVGPDGGRGSLEAYIGGAALRARFGDGLAAALGSLAADDPAMTAVVRAVRIGLAVYTPDLVMLLGGVGMAMSPRRGVIEAGVRRDLTAVAPAGWSLQFGTSRHHAALGAAWAASAGRLGSGL